MSEVEFLPERYRQRQRLRLGIIALGALALMALIGMGICYLFAR
jgi:hypothetical protein